MGITGLSFVAGLLLYFYVAVLFVVHCAAPHPAVAQSEADTWSVGVSGQAVFMERAPTGKGSELFAAWHRPTVRGGGGEAR